MTETDFSRLIKDSFAKNGLREPDLREEQAFFGLLTELLTANETTNLTAITDPAAVVDKHFADSLLGNEAILVGATVLDLGCGAGFPSLPLAIFRPDLQVIALDSTAKKLDFVQKTAKKLGISNLKTLLGRAEDPALKKQIGSPDIVVSRAVARLNLLCELALPMLRIGGALFAMKGAKGQEELAEAGHAIALLGGGKPILQEKTLILP